MSREQQCTAADAVKRLRMARMYLEVAELAAEESEPEALTVAAGNAVLAAIAASDALCCARLGIRHRGDNHADAAALLARIAPGGKALARELGGVLAEKDTGHYGLLFMTRERLKRILRKVTRLVEAADDIVPRP